MRLFIAVAIDPAVASALAAVGDELQHRASACAPRARIAWIPADRLHVTLRFIGEVEPDGLAAINAVLAPPVSAGPFDVAVGGVGAFPARGVPRVLWAGVADGAERLAGLEVDVTERLARCGVPPEERPFRPHLTLARVREAGGLPRRPLLDGLTDRAFGRTLVDAITLFHSRSSPQGPLYVPLQRTPLRGPT